MKKKRMYTKKELIDIGRKHQEHMTTIQNWNQYAKGKGLPSSIPFINQFSSWNNAKREIGVHVNHMKYTRNEIINTIEEHPEPFQKKGIQQAWEKYRKEYMNKHPSSSSLPTYATILKYVTPEAIRRLSKGYSGRLTKEELINVAKNHQSYFTSKRQWDQHAGEYNLPTSNSYIYAFGKWAVAKREIFKT